MSSNAMGERSSEFDKELEFLLRSTVNYLYLAQFETFRASLLTIRKKNPQLAVSILQAVVEKGGILQGPVAWSSRTTSSAQLVFLSLSELLELDSSNESVWGLDTDVLKLKAEFVLLIDSIRSRLISQNDASSQSEPVSDDELLFRKIAVALCDVIASQGLQRLRSAISRLHISETSDAMSTDEISCWRKITLLYPNLVDAVSQNVKNQFSLDRSKGVAGVSTSSSSIVSATPQEGNDFPLGVTIRREAQLAHIDAIKEALDRYDFDTCMHHLGFLHHDNPIDDSFYRLIVSDLTKKIKYQNDNIGKSWVCSRERILKAYEQFIASNDIYLVKMVEDTQDGLIQEESDVPSVSSEYTIPAPLKKLVRNFQALRSRHTETCEDTKTAQDLILACKRELFHYARVSGEHILEIVLKSALFAVKVERLQEASDILSIFPRLQPLVATMGWDLLSGKTIARRKMLEVLWTSKSNQLRLEDLSDYKKQGEEISCIEYLCDHLCYRLELAYFAACNSKGHIWDPTTCVLFSGRKERRISEDAEGGPLDSFVANFVLERLAVQTPLRVLFDVVPGIRFKEALELVNLQPIHSPQAAWHRVQDIELLHMHYGIQAAVLALGIMEKNTPLEETEKNITIVYQFLKEIQEHLEAVCSPPRKLFLVSILISLLHMDDITVNSSANATSDEEFSLISDTAENNSVVSVISFILKLLQDSVPSVSAENDSKKPWSRMIGKSGRQALEWRMATIKHFIEDWQWRLSVLQRLLPHPERQWTWKEALAILRAAPSTLLNFCMQRAQFDIGEEAVHRFALPPEDKVALQLAEWVDGAFTRASIEDAMSRVAEGVLNERGSLDFAAFQSRIGTLATALLCIDVALTSARSIDMSKHLLDQARSLLSDISLGSNQRGLSHWEEVQHMCIISVAKRIVQRLQEFVEHCTMTTLQGLLTGATVGSALVEIYRQGPKQRALISLEQVIEDAQRGKRQFLSGKLHNLVKAISDEDIEEGSGKVGITMERKASDFYEHDILLNLGFRPVRQASPTVQTTEQNIEGTHLNTKGSGKRFPFVITKQPSYLAAFVQYIATIGDIVDGIDTTHDFNYFTLVYEWPNDVLTRLVFERGNADAAGSVADIMGADLVHEVISACVPPVYPPVSNHGWACIPRVFYSNQNSRGSLYSAYKTCTVNSIGNSRSMQVQPQLYPLRLDVIKHLATLSPVRAVLACVFGSMFSTSNRCTDVIEPSSHPFAQDDDRVFYEFALDQSYRFPTLNRWIQMQANLHRLLDFPMASKSHSEKIPNKQRILKKRQREYQNDAESEEDENIHTRLGSKAATSACDMECKGAKSPSVLDEVRELTSVRLDGSESLFFDWENEGPYEETVERLISEGKLLDALALSDRCLREGASDQLLKLLIERGEEGSARSTQSHGYGVRRNLQSSSWQYCIRLRDKRLAANLALKYLRCWELGPAMDVLTMCICHLSESDPLRHEALSMKQSLQKYKHILNADGQFGSWQEVEVEFKQDPEGLALRLAGKGAVSAALEVAESASLSIELRRELQGRQLVKLLTTDPLSGGGPAEASRFLSSLQGPEDALPVAMGAMQLLPNLRSKQLLVHFLLKHRVGTLSDGDNTQLNRWALGLRVLAALPLPWQQRCSVLHEHPHLILETLLMWKQLQSAQKLINEFPSLMDEQLIFKYAAKSITVSGYPYTERRATATPVVNQSSNRTTVSAKSHFANSLSNLHKEARKAFSWTSRDSSNKLVPKEITRKRKSSGLPLSQRVAWEAMAGLQEDKPSIMSIDGQERPTTVATSEGCVLTGDPIKDEAVRQSFRYESTPDITLFKALLSLCLDDKIAAKGALELSVSEMKNILSSRNLPLSASTEIVGRAYHATETFVQALSYAKAQFKKIIGSTDMTVTASKDHDFEDMSSDTTSSSAGTSQNVEVADLLSEADWWLSHAKLLQSLLGSGIVASLDDVRDKESAVLLRDRLIREERYSMAVYTCKKCKIDAFPVWNAWGQALLRMEHYAQARVKFKQALQLYKDNPVRVILDIINIMESGPPVDLPGVRSLHNHLAKSAPTIMDDSLSADSYLNVLYMPTSFPRSERLRKPSEDSSDMNLHNLTEGNDDGPRSNLDSVRYTECVSYLQEYARQEILTFMFRHGHYRDACLLFFPPHSTPLRPQASVNQTQAASQTSQRTDPLATDYGTIEDLCDLCIGYGAMPVLERVIASRNTGCMDMSVREHTAAALTRICNYCETHRHFNHLYRFQVLKKDHVAAGLCSIQLFLNSSQQEQAFKHLEHAKMHFEEGLSARHKAGESVKNVSKTTRLKNASDKLTEEDLVKFSSRIGIQMDVVRSFSDADGPPWKHSLFGNPNDTETFRRRCEVAETLVERNFDLAFQIIYEFQLPAVHIYAGVAASLAERKRGNQLTEFLKNIKGTIDDDEWDQVLGAAINVFANKHRERPDRLIDMLSSSHRKVLACVVCGRLKTAFQIASRSGNVADVQYVAHQALKTGALPVLDMCKQWLQQYM